MMNSLNLICYFLALFTTLSTAAVVRDVYDGHNDTVFRITHPAVPDRMVDKWISGDVKWTSSRYRDAAMVHDAGFCLDLDRDHVSQCDWRKDGARKFDADHVFEAQIAAKILNELEIPKDFAQLESYKTALNSQGNMRFLNPSVNKWKGGCMRKYLSKKIWQCNRPAVESYMLSKTIMMQMTATVEKLDNILGLYKGFQISRHSDEFRNLYNAIGAADLNSITEPEPKENLAFRVQASSIIEWLSKIFLIR